MVHWNVFESSAEVHTINIFHKYMIRSVFIVHLHTHHKTKFLCKKVELPWSWKNDYKTSPLFANDPVNHSILKQYEFCRCSTGETTVVRRYATGLFSSRPHLHIRLIWQIWDKTVPSSREWFILVSVFKLCHLGPKSLSVQSWVDLVVCEGQVNTKH